MFYLQEPGGVCDVHRSKELAVSRHNEDDEVSIKVQIGCILSNILFGIQHLDPDNLVKSVTSL
jgi:hypothetical protein